MTEQEENMSVSNRKSPVVYIRTEHGTYYRSIELNYVGRSVDRSFVRVRCFFSVFLLFLIFYYLFINIVDLFVLDYLLLFMTLFSLPQTIEIT